MTERHRAHYIGAPEFFELNQACRTQFCMGALRVSVVSDDVCTCVELPGALCPVCHAGVGR